jgi:DNA-binding NarL/FixJ family response regulator
MSATRIVLVEDDRDFRDRLAALLGAEPDFCIAGAFGDIRSALACLLEPPDATRIDVLLADLGLPDGNGIELVRLCARMRPRCEIAVVTLFADSESVFACLEAGATGYILKDEIPSGIVGSVRMLLSGGSPVSPSIARRLLSRLAGDRNLPLARAIAAPNPVGAAGVHAGEALSAREAEILELVAKGLATREIGKLLAVSPFTVGTHVKNIYRKLSVHSRTEAVFEARGVGLLRD